MAIAAMFPGQGSQAVGMLAELLAAEPSAAAAFAEAGDALGYDLAELVRNGPAERLNQTEVTQPVMLAAGVAAWRAWEAHGGPQPAALAGHSLGEYTALVCAGSLDFGDALRIVRLRGQWMQQAVPAEESAVAAVLGLDDAAVEAACAEAAGEGGVVQAVNFNAPGQVVIAGHRAAVARAIELAQAAGARRAMTLPVSAPVHSSLMNPVGEKLAQALAEIRISAPAAPVYHNVDTRPRSEPEAIRDALARQVHSPVLWVGCVQAMQQAGVSRLFEIGPGRVLCGLAKRIDRSLAALPVDNPETLAAALAAAKEA